MPGVVGTLMTNMAVELALRARGVEFVRAKVGDRYVLEELVARGWLLGGEGSGHLLALDKHTTGDGIVSALHGAAGGRAAAAGRSPSCSTASTLFPQTLINVRLQARRRLEGRTALLADAAPRSTRELGDSGRVLIRPSGTEPRGARDGRGARRRRRRSAAPSGWPQTLA